MNLEIDIFSSSSASLTFAGAVSFVGGGLVVMSTRTNQRIGTERTIKIVFAGRPMIQANKEEGI